MKARPQRAMPRGASPAQARRELAERLGERRGEIEEALLTRTYAIADPKEASDPEYEQGLRAAVSAALDYGLATVERGEERTPQVPVLLLAQARLAARNAVPLDTVLRRYFAGYTLLGDFIVQEAGEIKLGEAGLKRLLRDQAAMFDRFLVAVSEEYSREAEDAPGSLELRRAERIERLLEGELLDTEALNYDLTAHHTCLLARGPEAEHAIRRLAGALDRALLLVKPEAETAWAWLGGRYRPDPAEQHARICSLWPEGLTLAIGEPGEGLAGWRLSHRQATAAFTVAQRGRDEEPVRYGEVVLLAASLQSDLLADSLRQLYLGPLERERDGGQTLRETLRAYLEAGSSLSSAATALGVSRRTVSNRIHRVEELIGGPLHTVIADLDTALRLQELARVERAPVLAH